MKAKAKTKTASSADVTEGSGNVFADLGFGDSAELQVKAELTRQLYLRIKEMALTQKSAAAQLGVSQPDVSKLMASRHTGFSITRLFALLNKLDVDVEIVVRKHSPKSAESARTRIAVDVS